MDIDFHDVVERLHEHQNPTSQAKLDKLITCLNLQPGQRILDIGCGKSWLLRRIIAEHAVEAVGVEVRGYWIEEAQRQIAADAPGSIKFVHTSAKDYTPEAKSFDVVMCIGASFAIGTFDEMLDYLKPAVKPGGIIAVGDIYARQDPMPEESAVHFSGGEARTLEQTAAFLNSGDLSLTTIIDSSLDDWDSYESLHWHAAETWMDENPDHPDRDEFYALSEQWKINHVLYDRQSLGWALYVCRLREHYVAG